MIIDLGRRVIVKSVFISGISGSIGEQTLEVLNNEYFKNNFHLIGGSVFSSWGKLKKIIDKYDLKAVAVVDDSISIPETYNNCKIFKGLKSVENSIEYCKPDITVVATSGFSGIKHTIKAIEVSKRVCLANKESVVCGGNFIFNYAKQYNCQIVPIDSEHSAIFQLLMGEKSTPTKIILTASGGSLRDLPIKELENVSVQRVLNHPVWSMGKRITIDSASMVNKGLELFEAFYLFNVRDVEVAINRTSRIHSMVQFSDGVIKMHYGIANMKIPIAFSLSYPERKYTYGSPDLFSDKIEFYKVDYERYPALQLAYSILGNPVLQNAFNAADEVAVEYFLKDSIKFTDIYKVLEYTVNQIATLSSRNKIFDFKEIDDILKIDKNSREIAKKYIMEVIK